MNHYYNYSTINLTLVQVIILIIVKQFKNALQFCETKENRLIFNKIVYINHKFYNHQAVLTHIDSLE